MATKRTNAATQTQPSEPTQRLGLTLDAQTHMLINAMATLRGCPPAELITDAIWQTVGGWQARERDSVLSIVRARFGRLKRSCGPAVAESVPEPSVGQGPSPAPGVVDSSAVVPALMARTTSITAMFNRAHAPIDEALDVIGGGN